MDKTPEAVDVIRRKANKVSALFSSNAGIEVLKILEDQFDKPDLRGDSVEDTYFNLGQRDVLIYLRQLHQVSGIEF